MGVKEMKIDRHIYDDRDTLAEALAISVAGILAGGIANRGNAVLAVSGGSTPKKFFNQLSKTPIDWGKVTIILVDERIAPPGSDRSNAKLVRQNLLVNSAAAADFQHFVVDGATPEECAMQSAVALAAATENIDALILGMGTDGHTASFFPGGDNLKSALDIGNEDTVVSMKAGGAGEPRLTLTLPVILDAHFLALHIEGEEKEGVLNNAMKTDGAKALPIATVINNAKSPIKLFWAP